MVDVHIEREVEIMIEIIWQNVFVKIDLIPRISKPCYLETLKEIKEQT